MMKLDIVGTLHQGRFVSAAANKYIVVKDNIALEVCVACVVHNIIVGMIVSHCLVS